MHAHSDSKSHLSEPRGFLPAQDPLTQLPNTSPFNRELNILAKSIPELIKSKKLRERIDILAKQFPNAKILIDYNNERERDIAKLILKMLIQAYVFADPMQPASLVPAILANNIYPIACYEQHQLALTYDDYIQKNWRRINSNAALSLDNIEVPYTLTGTPDEEWFIKIHVLIEFSARFAIQAAQDIKTLCDSLYTKGIYIHNEIVLLKIINAINTITEAFTIIIPILEKMKLGCHPDCFSNQIRHYLAGFETVKTLHENKEVAGVRYDTPEIKNDSYLSKGPSGAHSAFLPTIDATLKVKFPIDLMFQTLQNFKQYMPHAHQLIIQEAQLNKLDDVIRDSQSTELIRACLRSLKQLALFRNKHYSFIYLYIVNPAVAKGLSQESIFNVNYGTGGAPANYLPKRSNATDERIAKLEKLLQSKFALRSKL